MRTWFLCKISYLREAENGKITKIKEQYLVDALSFTEAEARLYHELSSTVPEFMLTNVSKLNLTDLFFYDDTETWFKCKVTYVDVDERTGKEKKIVNTMLVSAADVRQAYDRISESLSTLLVPFQITDVNLTPILEIFPYHEDGDTPRVDPDTGEVQAAQVASFEAEAAAESSVNTEE